MAGAYLWVLLAVQLVTLVLVGYFIGIIAMERSRDAYGHGRMAALAFIPVANLWLLATRSKNEVSANRIPTIPLLTDGRGVVSGIVMIVAGVYLSAYAEVEVERRVAEAGTEQQSVLLASLIRSQGLEAALQQMAAEVPTPQQVDEITTLQQVEGQGSTFRYIYELSVDRHALSTSMRTSLTQSNCSGLRPWIEAGATLAHVYLRRDGSEIGTVTGRVPGHGVGVVGASGSCG